MEPRGGRHLDCRSHRKHSSKDLSVQHLSLTKSSTIDAQRSFAQQTDLSRVRRYLVPSMVMDVTRAHILTEGGQDREGALCWAGLLTSDDALVTTAIVFVRAGRSGHTTISRTETGLLYAHCHARGL